MALAAGTRIGAYEITSAIGAGGMGEVYRAKDLRLKREVALKVLPPAVAGDRDRLARFQREAEVLASLNHPHIAQIFGMEESAAGDIATGLVTTTALVMELVEGDDLAQRIARGPIPIGQVVPIARQIADALEAAHERGIIHRDLKPANIKVGHDGTVKVLDFGLAKAMDRWSDAGTAADRASTATLTSPAMTIQGMILGTAAYMAPEQARGQPVDKRADIWAFGVVLYEMLTGRQAFVGDNVSEVLASVLRDAPPLDRLPAATPARVRGLLARCLDRDPRTRLRDIGEARVALSTGDTNGDGLVAPRRGSSFRMWIAAAAGVALGALMVTLGRGRNTATSTAALRLLPIAVDGLDLAADRVPMISPDGQRIVYSANGSVWVRELNRLDAQALPNTDGAAGFFWSPESTRIGFIRRGRLWTMPLTGQATSIAVLPGTPCGEPGGLWRSNGRILYSLSCNVFPLFEVADTGGDLAPALTVQKPAERDFHQLAMLPNGAVILALDRANAGVDTLVAWDGTTRRTVLQLAGERLASPVYSPTGHLLYQRTTTNPGVWGVPFSADRLEVTGDPFLVAANMAAPSIARDGTLLVVPMTATGTNQLAWIDRSGRIDARIDEEYPSIEQPRLSPDGRRVAFQATGNAGGRNIWIRDLADGTRTQITTGPELKWRPFWSPDGKYVYYDVEQPGRGARIERQPSAGGGKPEAIVDGGRSGVISADGRWLAYSSSYGETGRKLFKMRLDGDRTPSLLVETPGRPADSALSPDQRFIAYVIGDSMAEDGIYVRRFPEGDGQWQLDAAGGFNPRWSRKGDRLYFSRENELWEIDVSLRGDLPAFGRARRLFAGSDNRSWPSPYGFDVASDGRFLLVANKMQNAAPVMTLIENWQLGLINRR